MHEWIYILVGISAVATSIAVTPLAIRLGRSLRAMDEPGPRKVHTSGIPRLGGLAVFTAAGAALLLGWLVDRATGSTLGGWHLIVIGLAVATPVLLVGLGDDIFSFKPWVKLLAQTAAACAFCAWGGRIEMLSLGAGTIEFGILAWPITIFWILLVTNAVNLIDGLDGLAGGISAIACGAVGAVALAAGQPGVAVLMLALMGALGGFGLFNRHPAKIFLGDCGALFLGFMISSASVYCVGNSGNVIAIALPMLALTLPIVDTCCCIARRLLDRRSIFSADRQHMHHQLLDVGKTHKAAVRVMLVLTLSTTLLGLMMLALPPKATVGVFLCLAGLLIVALRSVTQVKVGPLLAQLWQNVQLGKRNHMQAGLFASCRLRMRESSCFTDWWTAVCRSAQDIGLLRLALQVTSRDGRVSEMTWNHPDLTHDIRGVLKFHVLVRHRRPGAPLELIADLPVHESLESTGRLATLFGRLIDEHSLADMEGKADTPLPGELTIASVDEFKVARRAS